MTVQDTPQPRYYEAIIKVNPTDEPVRRARHIEEGIGYACALLMDEYGWTADAIESALEEVIDAVRDQEIQRQGGGGVTVQDTRREDTIRRAAESAAAVVEWSPFAESVAAEPWVGDTAAEYIAAADPESVLALVAEVERLTRERDEQERAIRRLEVCHGIAKTFIPAARIGDYNSRAQEALDALRGGAA